MAKCAVVGLVATISASTTPANAATHNISHRVGEITWHAAKFASQRVTVTGFVLARGDGYILLSDEPRGKISSHDLPVVGTGVDKLQLTKKYTLEGRFLSVDQAASNGSLYRLALTAAP